MGAALWGGADILAPWLQAHGLIRWAALTALIGGGLALYFILARLFGVFVMAEIRRTLRRPPKTPNA